MSGGCYLCLGGGRFARKSGGRESSMRLVRFEGGGGPVHRLRFSFHDGDKGVGVAEDYPASFCPMCGRDLREWLEDER